MSNKYCPALAQKLPAIKTQIMKTNSANIFFLLRVATWYKLSIHEGFSQTPGILPSKSQTPEMHWQSSQTSSCHSAHTIRDCNVLTLLSHTFADCGFLKRLFWSHSCFALPFVQPSRISHFWRTRFQPQVATVKIASDSFGNVFRLFFQIFSVRLIFRQIFENLPKIT